MAQTVSNPIAVMKRCEMKYLLDAEKTAFVRERLAGHMQLDQFGLTSIASLYYDTPDYRLIRTSLEKPVYKEKLRLRSYGLATEDSPVFLELKRKAFGVVYKRRVQTTLPEVQRFFAGDDEVFDGGQISREIKTFRDFYRPLNPACLILYDRSAYKLKSDGRKFLDRFLPIYIGVLFGDDFREDIAEIIIEGHTDTESGYMYNLGLSQQRALSVVEYILSDSSLSSSQKEQLRSIITANGRSFSNPVYNDKGKVDAARSRRVEVKFRLKDEEMILELQKILEGGLTGEQD